MWPQVTKHGAARVEIFAPHSAIHRETRVEERSWPVPGHRGPGIDTVEPPRSDRIRYMNIHWLQHVPFEGLGAIEGWAESRGHEATPIRLWAGDLPGDDLEVEMLIVVGGPMGVGDEDAFPWLAPEKRFISTVIDTGIPVVGICLGAQLVAEVLGADRKSVV